MDQNDRALLDFEDRHPRDSGRKEELIGKIFGYQHARYYQRLLQIIGDPDAIAEYPMLVKRLQRQASVRAKRGDG